MKPIGAMTQAELAAYVQSYLRDKGIELVLSGGATVAIYCENRYVSRDLDLINLYSAKRQVIKRAMEEIGFLEVGRHFKHPDTEFLVEFPPGPLSVGVEPVGRIDEIQLETGSLKIISPTDCVKDRLSAYYHWGDQQCLLQVIMVIEMHPIDIAEVRRWSKVEGKLEEFNRILPRLRHA